VEHKYGIELLSGPFLVSRTGDACWNGRVS